MGTLQRLPRIVGDQRAAELSYTGRTFTGKEAEQMGLVLQCFDTEADMMKHVNSVAAQIASKSPITTRYEYTDTTGIQYLQQKIPICALLRFKFAVLICTFFARKRVFKGA